MTLRPEYSLGHSAYNDFLHAPLGHDAQGTELTVLSGLTRLGLDPWAEAARLADLSRPAAALALADAIARLPGIGPLGVEKAGPWTESEVAAVALRLVASLPRGSVPPVPETAEVAGLQPIPAPARDPAAPAQPAAARKPRPGATTWLLWSGLAVAFYLLVAQLGSVAELEPAGRVGQDQQ